MPGRQDGRRDAAARRLAVASACALAVAGGAARARPFDIDDLLQREGVGRVVLTQGGRGLVVELRRPLAAGARFDFGRFNTLFRTQLMVADLRAGTGLRPLIPSEPGTGFQAGPVSPDGERIAVFRLSAVRWELGVVTLATGAVQWTGVSPDISDDGRTLQWLSPTRLAVIASAPSDLPFELKAARPQTAEGPLWRAAARGDVAVTAVGSGRNLAQRPHAAPKRLLVWSTKTGLARTLAEGDFVDLEASPSGARLALIEAAEDIPLMAGRPVQAAYGVAVRRMRLRILDLDGGGVRTPCPTCDTLTSLLSWSPNGDAVLAYVRPDGTPWSAGHLVRVGGDGDGVAPIGPGLAPMVSGRPERVYAGWWGGDPLVFGHTAGEVRNDWFRLGRRGAVRLTGGLDRPSRGTLIVTHHGPLLAADGAAWRLGRDGRATRLSSLPFSPLPRRGEGIPDRSVFALDRTEGLAGVLGLAGQARAVRFTSSAGPGAGSSLASGERPLEVSAEGVLVDRVTGGGAETFVWRRPGAPDQVLAQINVRLANLDRPAPLPITHAGPNGETLHSWLFLPAGPAPAPLVVVPYPGTAYATPPTNLWDAPPMAPTAMLVGHGYAVLVPSLPAWRDGQGPADGLADRVLAIVDVVARSPELAGRIDASRLGLWGHSFGGYATAVIVTQTHRFAAAVATAAPTDLVSFHGQFEPFRRIHPEEGLSTPWTTGWTESLQGDMRAPPWEAPDRYRRNSPIMQAGRITTPMLLAYGELDGPHPGQAEELFSALFRQGKDAILLTYWGEGHNFGSPGAIRDLYARAFSFLDAHLAPSPQATVAGHGAHPPPGSASSEPTTPAPPRR